MQSFVKTAIVWIDFILNAADWDWDFFASPSSFLRNISQSDKKDRRQIFNTLLKINFISHDYIETLALTNQP